MDQGYGSRLWIMQYHGVWIGVWIMEYGSCVGPGPWSMLCIFTRIHLSIYLFLYPYLYLYLNLYLYLFINLSINQSIYLSIDRTCLLYCAYCACHACCIFADPLQMSHACHRLLEMLKYPHVLLACDKAHNPLRLPRKMASERPKVLRSHQFFTLLTSKCASRHNGLHFFDMSTSKSGPGMVCFVLFDFQMCFAPQRRATFHLSSGQMAPHPPL